ncbi:hypothetical protein ACOXXX_17420 [Thalassococcus sp. BH17M4-6]|uniref:hypothetical protein n=1 Tax=Thalassococcus sp. BH17M4-6 TaxID=3413148 RepID=UPI003BBF0A4A
MINDVFRCRPMLVGEVARVAGDPRETIRTRLKQGVFSFDRPRGWKRFTDFETIIISTHARIKRATQDDDVATLGMLLASKAIMDEWQEDEAGVPYFSLSTFTRDRMLVFWRDENGDWMGEIYSSPDEITAAINLRLKESFSSAPVFTAVNLRTILLSTIKAIAEVQSESEASS